MPGIQIVQSGDGKWAVYDSQQPWLILDTEGDKPTIDQATKALQQAAAATGTPSRSSARIGPTTPGESSGIRNLPASATIGPAATPQSVTVGDFMEDPRQAASRIVDMVKQQLTDPKNLPAALGLAIGAFQGLRGAMGPETDYMAGGWEPKPPSGPGPGAPSPSTPAPGAPSTPTPAAPSSPSGAPPTVGQVLRQEGTNWMIDKIPGGRLPRVAAKVWRAYQQAKAAAQTAAPTAAPTATAPPSAPPEAAPVPTSAPGAPAGTPQTQAPSAPAAAAAPATAPAATTIDLSSLTPAEVAQATKWHEQGVDAQTILQRIAAMRELTESGGLRGSTPEDAFSKKMAHYRATGEW